MPNKSMSLEHVVLRGSRRNHRPGAQVLGRSNRHEWCEITVKPGFAVPRHIWVGGYGVSD
jgi:hypothetical protein